MSLDQVHAGDLIKHSDWNDLIAALKALDERVSSLDTGVASDQPVITQVIPAQVLTAGDTVYVFGRNFDYSHGVHNVSFGGKSATYFLSGSSDSLLIVQLPEEITGATPTGAPVTMRVTNLHGYTTWPMVIKSLPVTPPAGGSIVFTHLKTEPTQPKPNEAITFTFTLQSQTKDTTVTIKPTARHEDGSALVSDQSIQVLENNELVANRQINLAESATTNVQVYIQQLPNEPEEKFSVTVEASAPGLTPVSVTVSSLQIGHDVPAVDPTVTAWQFNSSKVDNGTVRFIPINDPNLNGQFEITRTSVITAASLTVELDATFDHFSEPGQEYLYVLRESIQTTQGWTIGKHIDTPPQYRIQGVKSEEFPAWVVTTGIVTGDAVVTLGVDRDEDGTTLPREVKYRVRLVN